MLPPGVPTRRASVRARVRDRARLALALARAPPAARLAARRRRRHRLGGRASREGPRLRGVDDRRCSCSPRSCAAGAASTSPATRARCGRCSLIALAALAAARGDARHRAARRASCPTGSATSSRRSASSLGFSALFLWLRPLSQAVAQTVGERRLARELVETYGSDSLSFFALRRDKSFFFSPTRRAFLAYRVVAGRGARQRRSGRRRGGVRRAARRVPARRARARLAARDPRRVAREPSALPAARHARDRDRQRGGAAAGRRSRSRAARSARCGSRSRALTKARLHVPRRRRRRRRRRAARAARRGLRGVARQPGRARLLDGDGRPLRRGHDVRARGVAGGRRSAASCIWRRRRRAAAGRSARCAAGRATPNGLTEFLVVETLAWAKERGVAEVSLNFCALDGLLSPERAVTVPRRVLRRALLAGDSVFQLERLHSFSRKFHPGVAAALPLRREARRPAARRARVPARRAAADAAVAVARSAIARVTLEAMAQPATRSLGRLSEIAQVMVRHGFGYFLEAHKLTDLLPGRSAETRLAAVVRRRLVGARPAPARAARRARPDVREVRAAALDAPGRRAAGHHRRAARAPGRRAPVPVRAGRARDRGGSRQLDRAALPRVRAASRSRPRRSARCTARRSRTASASRSRCSVPARRGRSRPTSCCSTRRRSS